MKTRSDRKAEIDANDTQHAPKPKSPGGGKLDPAGGMFRQKQEHIQDGKKPAGITKQSAKPKASAHLHPLFLKFKTATDGYRNGAEKSLREDLEGIHDELIARVDRIDMNGKELIAENLPTKSQLEQLKLERAKLLKPFSEDTINTEFTRPDGTIVTSAQPLGRTMAHFEKKVKETQARLEPLFKELKDVDEVIAAVLAELGEDDATKKAAADFDKKVETLKAEADAALRQTMDDVANARKEDKKTSEDAKKKLEEFLNSW